MTAVWREGCVCLAVCFLMDSSDGGHIGVCPVFWSANGHVCVHDYGGHTLTAKNTCVTTIKDNKSDL